MTKNNEKYTYVDMLKVMALGSTNPQTHGYDDLLNKISGENILHFLNDDAAYEELMLKMKMDLAQWQNALLQLEFLKKQMNGSVSAPDIMSYTFDHLSEEEQEQTVSRLIWNPNFVGKIMSRDIGEPLFDFSADNERTVVAKLKKALKVVGIDVKDDVTDNRPVSEVYAEVVGKYHALNNEDRAKVNEALLLGDSGTSFIAEDEDTLKALNIVKNLCEIDCINWNNAGKLMKDRKDSVTLADEVEKLHEVADTAAEKLRALKESEEQNHECE